MGSTISANRALTNTSVPALNVSKLAFEGAQEGASPVFHTAVVEDVIFDVSSLSAEDKDALRKRVSNPEAVDHIGNNFVVGVLTTDGAGSGMPIRLLLPPFFQGHLQLPVQAGEQVHVVLDDAWKFGLKAGRWLTRITEGSAVEDPNFTHGDRRFLAQTFQSETRLSSASSSMSPNNLLSFPNGGNRAGTWTLTPDDFGGGEPFEHIYTFSSASALHAYEAVPKWSKRPQEFVLEGMNNAVICLGQDRTGPVSSSKDQKIGAGTIDMVVGRGRGRSVTTPATGSNARGLAEAVKPNPNKKSGDPNMVEDAARIYVSANTRADENFRLKKSTTAERGAANNALQEDGISFSPTSLHPVEQPVSASYVVAKADHVRMVARRKSGPQQRENDSGGSVLILKEGINRTPENPSVQAAPNDHMAYLFMSPDGRVQLDGLQLFLGGASLRVPETQTPNPDIPNSEAGADLGVGVGNQSQFAGKEPWIKWSEFVKVVAGLQQQINDLHNCVAALTNGIESAGSSTLCTPWGPDEAWPVLAQAATEARNTLERQIATHRPETNKAVYRARSAKIFGQ